MRASDVRVSNRVNKASVALKRYPTVYNDLIGEVRVYSTEVSRLSSETHLSFNIVQYISGHIVNKTHFAILTVFSLVRGVNNRPMLEK